MAQVAGSRDQVTCPAVEGGPRLLLRAEGLVLLAAGLWAFASTGEAWWLVPLLLFVPDVLMVGYARSAAIGAALYNTAHSYLLPAAVGGLAVAGGSSAGKAVAAIWFAHIGMDRALGYGLKYATGFRDTHLGRIGRPGENRSP